MIRTSEGSRCCKESAEKKVKHGDDKNRLLVRGSQDEATELSLVMIYDRGPSAYIFLEQRRNELRRHRFPSLGGSIEHTGILLIRAVKITFDVLYLALGREFNSNFACWTRDMELRKVQARKYKDLVFAIRLGIGNLP